MQKDKIRIEKLEIYAYHGVFEEEKKKGQKFYLTVEMTSSLREAGKNDDLTCSTHYGEVADVVVKAATEKSYDLIETVAEKCAEEILLHFPRIEEVAVTVSKPEAPIAHPFEDVSVTVARKWHKAYLSYGSNMGDKEKYINEALNKISGNVYCRNLKCSSLYETEPYGGVEQDSFINGACVLETLYTPHELLAYLHTLENEAGRIRTIHWGPRTLDMDIIFYDDLIMETEDLIIPHIDMHNRLFVLEPLSELTQYKEHPVLHQSIATLMASLKTS